MIFLKQSTASQEVPLGYFVDSTDGNTEETGLTIANTDIKIWKTGATTLASKNSGGATHISNGVYYAVLDATDTDTIGPLVIFVHVSGALTVRVPCCVLDEAVFDVLFGTTALATTTNITAAAGVAVSSIGNNVITAASIASDAITAAKIADGAIDANTFASGAITATAIAADAIGASELAADAVAEIADAIWDEATLGHTTAGTFGEQCKTDIDDILTDTGTTLQAEVDGIQADTEDIQNRLPAALVGGRIDANVGAISADATAADNAESFFDGTGYAGTGNTIPIVTTLTNAPSDSSGVTTLLSRVGTPTDLGGGASIAANLSDIEAQTDDIGAAGAGLTAIPWNASWDAEVESEVADALEATIADSIPADGSRPSVKQALYMLTQFMIERSVSSTTVTVKKPDGSTSLFTLTLDDATSPTSITRST